MKTGKKQPDHVTCSTLSKPKYIENTKMMGVVCNFISTPIYFQCQIKLVTEDRVKAGQAAYLLRDWGCCVLCTFRFLGEKQIGTYRRPIEVSFQFLFELFII